MEPYRVCPACSLAIVTSIGAARQGGGYRLQCYICLHEWDDRTYSCGEAEDHVRRLRHAP
jgi:formate dehydrogenase maturation protein FdhE